jgi:hypothetical protein
MTVDEVRLLPVAQKIQIMEAIWEDLRDRVEASEIPEGLQKVLDRRRERVREGAVHLVDWDRVKSSIGRV